MDINKVCPDSMHFANRLLVSAFLRWLSSCDMSHFHATLNHSDVLRSAVVLFNHAALYLVPELLL